MATSVRVETIHAAASVAVPGNGTNGAASPAVAESRPVIRCERCRLVQFQASHNRCRRCLMPFVTVAPPPPEPVVEAQEHPNIAAGVRSLRQMRGLTQKQLAFAAQLPRTYISRIENGRILPGLSTLERVALALRVGLPTLLDRRTRNGCNGHLAHSRRLTEQEAADTMAGGVSYGALPDTSDAAEFLRQMVRYTRKLSEGQRAMVIERVRELAQARC